jgi:hypothetical protein
MDPYYQQSLVRYRDRVVKLAVKPCAEFFSNLKF